MMLAFVGFFMATVAWMAPRIWRTLRRLLQRGSSGGAPDDGASRAPEGGGEVTLGGVQGG